MPKQYVFLLLAVMTETAATSALQASQQFTRLIPSAIVVLGYALSFYLLSLTLKYMPLGIVYAMWSGLGVVFIALIGWLAFNQRIDIPAIVGMGLIVAGIVVINLFSETAMH
ncbi:small multidrug resistance pump [Rhodovulum imhoffii]|uniref:Small multidrug resistance pump n=1 Tax=Rhodovulum imhoffii TaxID=365340 RepID=A0A2T5BVD6_9RHOB|nr:SMR family transporter [Rhodovulum imhoffii]MBK5934253.1 QacE family quaternary ammonium compound efflux SMR transporter [Rhodovulum imhoffii]PTN03500.1 small multidrug resistance pump [Rhodovulum imhoffii]